MRLRTTVLVLVACGATLALAPAAEAATTKVFTTKTTSTTVVAPATSGRFFTDRQLVNAKCGRGYAPLALGIASATNPLAAQDLGGGGMSVYASGASGTARTRLQALCVRGGRTPDYIGDEVELGSTGSGFVARRTLSCRPGQVALGAALSHGHAPAFGAYTSMPDGKRKWTYSAQIPQSVVGQVGQNPGLLGYPRAACVRATGVTTARFDGQTSTAAPAQGTARCRSGRVLGWGVQLGASSSSPGSDGTWAIPTIERAEFRDSRTMAFRFTPGRDAGGTSATPVRAEIICGKLPRR